MNTVTFGLGRAIKQIWGQDLNVKGFKVEKVEMAPDKTWARLHGEKQVITMKLEADCCSSSYFDDGSVEDLKALEGTTLSSIEDVETGVEPNEYGRTILYALVIRTDSIATSILWRNDSNGYYSGWVEYLVEDK